ncbi:MAG: hypothetical protein JWO13_1962 [Acidobacteriales bacterium]|nr:hypothetical protein [Terriglobales bacterium]
MLEVELGFEALGVVEAAPAADVEGCVVLLCDWSGAAVVLLELCVAALLVSPAADGAAELDVLFEQLSEIIFTDVALKLPLASAVPLTSTI